MPFSYKVKSYKVYKIDIWPYLREKNKLFFQQISMPVQRRIQLRRCKLCGKTGHNRAKCLLFLKKEDEQKMAESKQNNKLSKSIFVKTFHTHLQSPHVVDLKKAEINNVWGDVSVFSEAIGKKEVRKVADLAGMVREANQNSKFKIQNSKIELKKYKINLSRFNIAYRLSLIKNLIREEFQGVSAAIAETKKRLLAYFKLKKLAYAFVLILIIITLPFPAIGYYRGVKDTSAKVVAESTNAFLSLQSSTIAAFQANLPQAEYDLNAALKSFGAADEILNNEHQLLQYVVGLLPVIGNQVEGRQHLLTAGHHLTLGNTYLVKGIAEAEKTDATLTDKFAILTSHLRSAIPQYQEALVQLTSVDNKILPTEYQQPFNEFKLLFTALIDDLQNLVDLSSSIDVVFGGEQLRRYLLVFQNQNELRPTGGFMGSFAVLDVQKGKIMNLDIPAGGTYDLQGQLDVFVKPPLPLQLMNKRWEFQDANWFFDFSASAQKIEWFYEHGRNTTVDGVIAINASVLERLLKVLGPITSKEQDLQLIVGDAVSKLQYKVEKDYDKEANRPKEVLGELAGQFLDKFKFVDAASAVRLLTELHQALEQKEIQVYFNDKNVQEHFQQFGWTGEILTTGESQDYLAIVGANLQGEKSDAKIKQVVDHQAVVQGDGSVIDTVVIHRRHLGAPGEMFYGVNNVQYIRVFAPLGSELLASGGFVYPPEEAFHVPEEWYQEDADLEKSEQELKIDADSGTRVTNEFGKTVFGNWLMVQPGEAGSIYFTYHLPFKVKLEEKKNEGLRRRFDDFKAVVAGQQNAGSHYSLLIQKQSGANSDFSSRIIYPTGWQPMWKSNDDMNLAMNGAEYSTVLDEDKIIGLVMEKHE